MSAGVWQRSVFAPAGNVSCKYYIIDKSDITVAINIGCAHIFKQQEIFNICVIASKENFIGNVYLAIVIDISVKNLFVRIFEIRRIAYALEKSDI